MTDNTRTAAQDDRQAAPVSRRHALMAGGLMVATAAVPAACVAADPDGALILLENQRVAAQRAFNDADATEAAALQRYAAASPRKPASIMKQDRDAILIGFGLGRDGYFTRYDVEPIKAERERHNALFQAHGCNRRGVERCDEILAGLATYVAADDAAREAHGLATLADVTDAANERLCEIEKRIFSTPAHGVTGWRIKAAAVARHMPARDEPDFHEKGIASLLADILGEQPRAADLEAELAANTSAGEA